MKILVTGFEPFGGETINPSGEVAKLLTAPQGAELVVEILPVPFGPARTLFLQLLEQHKPDIVLSLGQAGSRVGITPELVAVNLLTTWAPDSSRMFSDGSGTTYDDDKLEADGPDAYFTNLPIREMVRAINKAEVPASVSLSAGGQTCNQTMYLALHAAATKYPGMKADFIHLPFLPEQMDERKTARHFVPMELETMRKGVQAALELVAGAK